MKEKILTIVHDSRVRVDGGVCGFYSSLNNIIREYIILEKIYVEKTAKKPPFLQNQYIKLLPIKKILWIKLIN